MSLWQRLISLLRRSPSPPPGPPAEEEIKVFVAPDKKWGLEEPDRETYLGTFDSGEAAENAAEQWVAEQVFKTGQVMAFGIRYEIVTKK